MRRVDFHQEAGREFDEAVDWYRAQSATVARAFLREVHRALDLISRNPESWPVFEGNARRILLRRFPFAVIYRLEREVVFVIAVAHGRRRPGYWRGR